MFHTADRFNKVTVGVEGQAKHSSNSNIPGFLEHFNRSRVKLPKNGSIEMRILDHINMCNGAWMSKMKLLNKLICFIDEVSSFNFNVHRSYIIEFCNVLSDDRIS